MVTLPRAEVVARIEAARAAAAGAGAVAFDGDGTLWSGDIGEDFFHALVARADFRAPAVEGLRAEARAFQISPEGSGLSSPSASTPRTKRTGSPRSGSASSWRGARPGGAAARSARSSSISSCARGCAIGCTPR